MPAGTRTRGCADDVSGPALLWLHPELQGRVAFDARLEIFSQHALAGYTDFVAATGDGWDRIVPSYDVIVVSRTLNPVLARKVVDITGWRPIESDHEGVVLVH